MTHPQQDSTRLLPSFPFSSFLNKPIFISCWWQVCAHMQLRILTIDILFQQDQQMSDSQLEHHSAMHIHPTQMSTLGFEKNYPKNIFIPILEHLNDLGLRQHYEQCVGTRELFEGKNVVSLAVLHHLISQPWFNTTVDRQVLISVVCNKILVNSKIKKKLFHLKVAEVIIGSSLRNEKDFRHHVSRSVAQLSTARVEPDDFFQFPNLTIYLFHLLACVLDQDLTSCLPLTSLVKTEHRSEENQDEEDSHPNRHNVSSKQEFRLYVKLIIKVFNDQRFNAGQFAFIVERLQRLVEKRQKEFQEKYCLPQGVLNWALFVPQVAQKCLAFKSKGYKLTNLAINEWIDNFKTACLRGTNQSIKREEIKMVPEEHTDHEEKPQSSSGVYSHTTKAFSPIILQHPLYPFSP